MAVNAGMQKLIAAVRRKHPQLPQQPPHPATNRAPRPVVARWRLHGEGAPPAGTTDKMLAPITNQQTMKGYAKAKRPKRRATPARAARTKAQPMKLELEIEITVNGKKHTAKAVRESESETED